MERHGGEWVVFWHTGGVPGLFSDNQWQQGWQHIAELSGATADGHADAAGKRAVGGAAVAAVAPQPTTAATSTTLAAGRITRVASIAAPTVDMEPSPSSMEGDEQPVRDDRAHGPSA